MIAGTFSVWAAGGKITSVFRRAPSRMVTCTLASSTDPCGGTNSVGRFSTVVSELGCEHPITAIRNNKVTAVLRMKTSKACQ